MRAKRSVRAGALIALTFLAGCIPSLNPVYQENQLTFDPDVVGSWEQSKNKWEFTKRDDSSYTLVFTDEKGRQGRFIARLAEIEGTRFLDLFPEEEDEGASTFHKFHHVPIHTFYLVKETNPNLKMASIDIKWIDKYLTENPQALQHVRVRDHKMLTAPTTDIQTFVLKHQDRFTGDFTLQKLTRSVGRGD